MSFVKDDHAYTRGVGAVAAVDAASPTRRMAVARAAKVMARRDQLMSRSTLGKVMLTSAVHADKVGPGPTGGGIGGGRPIITKHPTVTGSGSGDSFQTYKPTTVKFPGATLAGRASAAAAGLRQQLVPTISLPGATSWGRIPLPGAVSMPFSPVVPTTAATATDPSSGVSADSGSSGGGDSSMPDPTDPTSDPSATDDLTATDPTATDPTADLTVAPPATSSPNYLLYGALAVGAYLLLRKGK